MNRSRKESHSTRRDFLFTTMGSSLILPFLSTRAAAATSANNKIQLGVIGIGPRCRYVLGGMLKSPDVRCVAIADVQASRRNAGKELVDGFNKDTNCKLYRDFRELLERKDIDAVLIATGDRWHAAASMLAARAGKDDGLGRAALTRRNRTADCAPRVVGEADYVGADISCTRRAAW